MSSQQPQWVMTSAVNKLQGFFRCTFHQKPRKGIISYTDFRTNVQCFQLQVYFWLINWWKHANILPPLQCFKREYPQHSCLSCPLFGSTELIPNPQQSAGHLLLTLHWHAEQWQRMMLKKGRPSSSTIPTPKKPQHKISFSPPTIILNPQIALKRGKQVPWETCIRLIGTVGMDIGPSATQHKNGQQNRF